MIVKILSTTILSIDLCQLLNLGSSDLRHKNNYIFSTCWKFNSERLFCDVVFKVNKYYTKQDINYAREQKGGK